MPRLATPLLLAAAALAFPLLHACSESPQPQQPVALFNGADFTGWSPEGRLNRNHWKIGTAAVDPENPKMLIVQEPGSELVSAGIVGADLRSQREFADHIIELEFMIPAGSNSGVFVHGEYEIQIFDNPKADPASPSAMDHGALVRAVPPSSLAPAQPGEWQTYLIEFRAPRFDAAGNKIANARLQRVLLNGKLIHENVEIPGPTPGGLTNADKPRGPLVLQGSEGPVAFRNITITPLQ